MKNDICWLVTLSNGEYLLRCAIRVIRDQLSGDMEEAPLEPENKEKIAKLLPMHVRSFGNIVEVEEISEVKG